MHIFVKLCHMNRQLALFVFFVFWGGFNFYSAQAKGINMITIDECSTYSGRELIKEIPKNAFWVPTVKVIAEGNYIKICQRDGYYRLVEFHKLSSSTWNYDVKEVNGQDVSMLINDPVNLVIYDDHYCTLKLSYGKILKSFIPDDTIYVKTGYTNEARVRIQIVEPGLYYATIYNVRGNFINYEGFMVDNKGRNADEVIKNPKNFRFAWDYIVLTDGYWLVKKLLSTEELQRLKSENKVNF